MKNLLEDDLDVCKIKFVNHVMKFKVQISEEVHAKCNKVFLISPHVSFENVAYFFLGQMLRRVRGSKRRVAGRLWLDLG